jgi:hypothetical protein
VDILMDIEQEGRTAFRDGISPDRSPYIGASENLRWITGWYAAEKAFYEARAADARQGPLAA